MTALSIVGAGAEEHAHREAGVIAIRPGGLPPEFAISWGATRWGVGDFTSVPNLEPKDRREYRARANAARRTQRLVASASIVMLAAAGAIQIPVAVAGNAADEERAVAETRKAASDSESEKLRAELESRMPPPRGPAGEMERILKAVIRFHGEIRIAEIRIERTSSAFATLRKFDAGSTDNTFTITGDAESLESIESLRSELSRSGISSRVEDARKSARTPNTIDFRIKVPFSGGVNGPSGIFQDARGLVIKANKGGALADWRIVSIEANAATLSRDELSGSTIRLEQSGLN